MKKNRAIKLSTAIFGTLGIFLYFTIKWLSKTFGHITFEQIVWNLINGVSGADQSITKSVLKPLFISTVLSVSWTLVVFYLGDIWEIIYFVYKNPKRAFRLVCLWMKTKIAFIRLPYVMIFLLSASIVFFGVQMERLDKRTGIFSFISNALGTVSQSHDFIKENSYFPKYEEISFSVKRDLVVVLAESLETSFFDEKVSKTPLPSSLEQRKRSGVYVNNFYQINNAAWTIAAMTAWHFGLPLKLPKFVDGNEYHSSRGFLPGAKSIFEIFSRNGYKLVLVLGSDSNYSGKRTLFKTHGNFQVLDKQYWEMEGWDLRKNGGTDWGYSDKFVLERAKEVYEKLKSQKEPFVLFVETVDTHAPNGYAPKSSQQFGDIRDAYLELDKQLTSFVDFIQTNNSDNTALAILGDHLFMGDPSFLATRDKRRIFNFFWTEKVKGVEIEREKSITALDIAPTLLELAGAKWNNHKYGMGVSIFSNDKNLTDKFSKLDEINERISQPSHFYNNLY